MTALDRLVWAVDGSYEFGGAEIGIRTTSKRFGGWLDSALAKYWSPKGTQPVYSIVIADGSDDRKLAKEQYHILYRSTVAISKTTDITTLIRTFRADLEQYLFPDRQDAIYADMNLLSMGEMNALVPAVLVPFLETLGRRRLARTGLSLPADTYVGIEPGTREVAPIQPLIELAEGSLEALSEAVPANGQDPRHVVDRPKRVDVVASVGWGNDPLIPVTKGLALHRLASHVANLEVLGGGAVQGLVPMIEGARTYELASLKPIEMLPAILQLFDEPA
jgi:hypothetical protein